MRVVLQFVLLFFLSSCVNRHSEVKAERKIALHAKTQKSAYELAERATFKASRKKINWQKAKGLMLKQNHQILSAEESLRNTRKRRKDLWIGLIPKAFAYLNIRASFDEILKIDSDNINAGITSNLNIPSPFSFYAEAYGLALQEIQQENNLEALRRRMHRDLYVLFLNCHDLEKEHEELKSLETPDQIDQLITFELKKKNEIIRYQDARERLRLRINRMFDTPNQNWELTGTLPRISYSSEYSTLSYLNGYGALGLRMQAVNIESNLISFKAGKRVNLPRYYWSISSPTLYDSSRDDNFNFSSEDFSLFSGLSKSIEFDDVLNKEKIKDAEYRYLMTQKKLKLTIESETSQLEGLKRRYAQLQERKLFYKKLIESINNSRGNSYSNMLLNKLEKLNSSQQELKTLEKDIKRLDLEIWIWDERYWSTY